MLHLLLLNFAHAINLLMSYCSAMQSRIVRIDLINNRKNYPYLIIYNRSTNMKIAFTIREKVETTTMNSAKKNIKYFLSMGGVRVC